MILALLAMLACDSASLGPKQPGDPAPDDSGDPVDSGDPDADLPILDAPPEGLELAGAPTTPGPLETEVAGTLAVSGADRDWTFSLTPGDGPTVSFDVHSAIGADLASLDGREVTVWLSEAEVYEIRSLVVRDAEGVAYAVDRGIERVDVNNAFVAAHGAALVSYGDAYGVVVDDIYRTTYHYAAFAGDAGTLQLAPGEVDAVARGGTTWKVGAIAAWQRELAGDIAPGCINEDAILAYEALRVATTPTPTVVSRPAGEAAAHLGCG